jgi:DNA (cytosine-5)-methyltransferase 1
MESLTSSGTFHPHGGKAVKSDGVVAEFEAPASAQDLEMHGNPDPRTRNGSPAVSINGNLGAYSKKLPKPTLINVVDFFCGCGGMSWGFAKTRQSHFAYRILGGVDVDRVALATYARNIGALAVREDIRNFADNPGKLSKALGVAALEAFHPLVFVGCPPCQGFSAHRKKDDRDDPRNDLSVAFARLCAHFRPDAIVMENVPEMLKGRFGGYFRETSRILEEAGYVLSRDVLDLSRYGVPQRRLRAVVLGALGTSVSMPEAVLENPRTVRDAIGHLNPLAAGGVDDRDPYHRAPSHIDRILDLIKRIPSDGGDRRALPPEVQLRCHSLVDKSATPGFTDVYGRLRWDSPSVTITAKSSTPSCGRFLHPEQHRNISVREAAILQGFPQEYAFEGPFVNQYRQIGEAVPPVFARCLAWQVLDFFNPQKRSRLPQFRVPTARPQFEQTTRVGLVDAFCGAGGFSMGLEAAGFESKYAFDSDASAVNSFNGSLQPVAAVADITSHDIGDQIAHAVSGNSLYVVVGGPPCQGFSQQRRGNDNDDRNNLVIRYAKVIETLPKLPAAVVLENVTYLDSPRGELILDQYVRLVEKLGFVTFRHDLNSAEFGVPQLRHRIIIVAIAKRFAPRYKAPLALTPGRWPTVGESLDKLPDAELGAEPLFPNHYASKEGVINKRRIMFVDMGRGRLSIPEELQLKCHRRYGGHLDVYGRLDWFSLARTITGGFDSFTRGEFAHPFFHRSITPREAARIQGFPDWFAFHGNRASVRRQIGNAVPPPMAFAIGKAVMKAITFDGTQKWDR